MGSYRREAVERSRACVSHDQLKASQLILDGRAGRGHGSLPLNGGGDLEGPRLADAAYEWELTRD